MVSYFFLQLGNENGCKGRFQKISQVPDPFNRLKCWWPKTSGEQKSHEKRQSGKGRSGMHLNHSTTGAPSRYDASSRGLLIPKLRNESGDQALWKSLVSSSLCKNCDS